MMFDLNGKTALVTGASGAIGGAIARALHAQGATVAISGTRKEALEGLAGVLGNRLGFRNRDDDLEEYHVVHDLHDLTAADAAA